MDKDLIDKNETLMVAAKNGDIDLVKKLLEAGADVNSHENSIAGTALGEAAASGHETVIMELLKQPLIDVNVTNNQNKTPLIRAIEACFAVGVYELLKQPGIKLDIKSADGTALDIAWNCRISLKDGPKSDQAKLIYAMVEKAVESNRRAEESSFVKRLSEEKSKAVQGR